MLQYHHCRYLDSVVYGRAEASSEHADEYLKDAYSWLENEVGFYPLFLAVGTTEDDIIITGYDYNWRRSVCQKDNKVPNCVLFSFDEMDGIYMDYMWWHLALGLMENSITEYGRRLIFKPSWPKSRWLRKAKIDPGSVQLVTDTLYLPSAKRIWVRNKPTKRLLETMGFNNIEVKRIKVEH